MRVSGILGLAALTLAACAPGGATPPASPVDVAPVPSAAPSADNEQSPDGRVRLPSMGAADKLTAEGRVYANRGEYPAALDRFENAYRISPSDEVLYEIGRALEHMGKRQQAANVYEKLLQGDLSSADRMSMEVRIKELRGGGPGGP